jgi:NADP-dependent aldehyde dehydrogenase
MMQLHITGSQLIGYSELSTGTESFNSVNPKDGSSNAWIFSEASESDVNRAVELAAKAFKTYRNLSPGKRAIFLKAIAEALEKQADAIVAAYMAESGLPEGRARGELGRTTGQLRSFAGWIEEGSWVQARIDTAQPERAPLPKPDIRKVLEPLGPVVVFGASNFPLAFSTAGGDTASALAAGCPVIVKGHPMHPATGELVARCVLQAARETEMPEGVFSLLQGISHNLGAALVLHPLTKAVGFTGSLQGGLALAKLGQQRSEPIPVFAEMGSVNPVVLLPSALQPQAGWAKAYAGSVTLGTGQFCTNPGLLIGIASREMDQFIEDLAIEIATVPASCMLHTSIADRYKAVRSELLGNKGVSLVSANANPDGFNTVPATVARVSGSDFKANPKLQEEVFGPFTLVVSCADTAELESVLSGLQGQLTASLIGDSAAIEEAGDIVDILREKSGRVLFNGVPTGVEVCPSMHHGGPFPATTDGRFTSVGNDAILRWVRPVSYQNCPDQILPRALKNNNPLGIMRLVDGALTRNPI